MFKHWVLHQSDQIEPPKFVFSVLHHYKDPMSRMIKEALLIRDEAKLNSKSEYKGYKLTNLSEKQRVSEAACEGALERQVKADMQEVRDRVEAAKAKAVSKVNTNPLLFTSRKRLAAEMAETSTPKKTVGK